MQCAAGAATAVGAASGIRAYLTMRAPGWLTPKRLKLISGALIATALLADSASVV